MARTIFRGLLLIAIGVTIGAGFAWRGRPETTAGAASESRAPGALKPARAAREAGAAALEQRVERLSATLAAEASERQRLEERLATLEQEIAALRPSSETDAPANDTSAASAPDGLANNASTSISPAVEAQSSNADESASTTERALIAAGVDSATAADIRRRRDAQTLSQLYLRDQAEREHWLDTPQFREQMEEIQGQQPSVRDEIGDDAYDRYLAALGEPNRVTVAEVMLESAAADAGLLSGDVVLRYGDARVFAPGDLVAETRAGNAGETVSVEILRNGRRLEINVPRGPLGLRIGAGHGDPNGG